jgi:hypothetical protein
VENPIIFHSTDVFRCTYSRRRRCASIWKGGKSTENCQIANCCCCWWCGSKLYKFSSCACHSPGTMVPSAVSSKKININIQGYQHRYETHTHTTARAEKHTQPAGGDAHTISTPSNLISTLARATGRFSFNFYFFDTFSSIFIGIFRIIIFFARKFSLISSRRCYGYGIVPFWFWDSMNFCHPQFQSINFHFFPFFSSKRWRNQQTHIDTDTKSDSVESMKIPNSVKFHIDFHRFS